MRCHICDTPLDEVKIDERDGSVKPCQKCLQEIEDILNDDIPLTFVEGYEAFVYDE